MDSRSLDPSSLRLPDEAQEVEDAGRKEASGRVQRPLPVTTRPSPSSKTPQSRPSVLKDYIQRFQEILDRHHTPAGFYAHASVGLLHIRPVVDLKTTTGVERFAAIANDVADLVLEFGGALSGEHGDGLVRAPFQERMFGPTLSSGIP